jgi:hypothetical protein
MQVITETRAVNWYYAKNGQQAGPIAESELDSLAQTGAVTPATLVWREGMAQWQPYAVMRAPKTPASTGSFAPPVIHQCQCVECLRSFAKDDLLLFDNVFVCAACKPVFFQKLREGVATGVLVGLWRSGKLLVMRKNSALPDRCTKCNKPANGFRLKRSLSWHTPWLYLLLIIAWVIYLIVALVASKKAKIEIGLCDEHRRIRNRDVIIAWLLFALSVGSFVLAATLTTGWPYGLGGVGVLLASLIYSVVRLPMVQAKRIDSEFVWLNGVCKDYMADLPEFSGRN